jgi:hypothetical protein
VLQLVLVLRLARVRAGDGYTSVRLVIGDWWLLVLLENGDKGDKEIVEHTS